MSIFGRKPRLPRRVMNTPAWITLDGGFGVLRCTVTNMSDSGAQLRVPDARKLPKTFHLSFQPGVRKGLHCQVVWRSASGVGIKFIENKI